MTEDKSLDKLTSLSKYLKDLKAKVSALEEQLALAREEYDQYVSITLPQELATVDINAINLYWKIGLMEFLLMKETIKE